MIDVIEADLNQQPQAEAVIELLDIYARDPMGGGSGLSEYAREHLIEALKKQPGCYIVLAYDRDKAVGLINCFSGFSTFVCKPLLNIHDVVVIPQARGRGIVDAMFEQVEVIARRLGCCKLTLEVLEGNGRAQAAYRRLGFDGYQLDPKAGRAMFWEKKL